MTKWIGSTFRRAVLYSAIAGLFAANNVAFLTNRQAVPIGFFVEPFIYWNLCGLLTPLLFWVVKRYPPTNDNLPAVLTRYAAAVLVASLAHEAVMFPLQVIFSPTSARYPVWLALWLAIKGIYFFSAIMLAVFAVEYYRFVNASHLRRSHLELSLSRAQYELLNNQIRPHFLFNTLNAMAALARENPSATKRMTLLLHDLLRRASERRHAQTVALYEELELLGLYVDIMRIRFSDSLRVQIDVSPQLCEASVPQFLLQPLVENAIKYAADEDGKMDILVTAAQADGNVVLRVADRGARHFQQEYPLGAGTGMVNLRRRLAHLYDNAATCDIRRRTDGPGVEVVVSLPHERRQYARPA